MPPKFAKLQNAYRFQNLTDDDIDVGDPDAEDFVPQMHMRKWGSEVWFKIKFNDEDIPKQEKNVKLEGETVHWASPEVELRFYPVEPSTYIMRHPQRISDAPFPEPNGENGLLVADIPFPQHDQGGLELEIILNTKPQSNTLTFDFETNRLKWYVQPPLHPDHPTWSDDNGDGEADNFRPENCVDSIVAFHATRGNFHKGLANAKKYKCGMAFTIYRPKAVDANGAETWCTHELSNNKYSITVPQAFLDAAAYPVTVDPSFGTTSVGGSSTTIEDTIVASLFTSPPQADVIVQINAYVSITNTVKDVNTCMYLHSDLSKKVQGTSATEALANNWKTRAVTPYTVTASTEYLLAVWASKAATNGVSYYASGAANQGHVSAVTYNATFPSPLVVDSHNTNNHSIYAAYETFVEPMVLMDKLTVSTGPKTYSRTQTEPTSFVDQLSAQAAFTYSRQLQEALELVDSLPKKIGYSRQLNEVASFVDSLSAQEVSVYFRQLNEVLQLMDTLSAAAGGMSYSRQLNEVVLLIDTLSSQAAFTYFRQLNEIALLVDTLSVATAKTYSQSLQEVMALTDTLSSQGIFIYSTQVNEAIALTDTLSTQEIFAYSRLLTEALAFTDAISATTGAAPAQTPWLIVIRRYRQ